VGRTPERVVELLLVGRRGRHDHPAISVLSAVEGLDVVSPWLESLVLPIALAILTVLFVIQRFGTGAVGRLFGRNRGCSDACADATSRRGAYHERVRGRRRGL